MRSRIIDQATADKTFDIAAAWETVHGLDESINARVVKSRSKQ